jgi:hypothetical protein
MKPSAGNLAGLRADQLAGGAPAPVSVDWPPAPGPTPDWDRDSDGSTLLGRITLPSQAQLDYTTKLITAALLLLALPALISALVTDPSRLLAGLSRRHVG